MSSTVAATARRWLALGAGVVLAVVSTGCGGTDPGSDGPARTVKGAYGEITVHGEPDRVVALTVQDAEILVKLGIQPVAVAVAEKDIAPTYPWLEGVFTGKLDPDLIPSGAADPEAIGVHEPDLIVGSTWTIAEDVYDQLSDIAPTFPGLAVANDDWDATTAALAELTGTDGDPVVSGVDEACGAARERLPGLSGKTYQSVASEKGQFRFGNGTWLECFGLVAAKNQDNTQSSAAAVSAERIEELDAHVLAIWDPDGLKKKVEADPRFADLPANTDGAVVWVDLPLAQAGNSPGPLSFDYVIERVVPELEAAGKN